MDINIYLRDVQSQSDIKPEIQEFNPETQLIFGSTAPSTSHEFSPTVFFTTFVGLYMMTLVTQMYNTSDNPP